MGVVTEFRKFLLRGNVVELAIGFTVGAAFTTIVKSLVDDVIMPPLSLFGKGADLSDKFILLRAGNRATASYASLAEAKAAGAITLNYGVFINSLITLLLVGAVMFFFIRAINRMNERLEQQFGRVKAKSNEPSDKKCPHCLSMVPYRATKCSFCTSELNQEFKH